MKRSLCTLAVGLLIINSGFAKGLGQETLCQKDERVLFSCPVRGGMKFVSLCSSRELSEKEGYLQYRFGRAGNVELEFPAQRVHTQTMFRYSYYFRYQVERTTVSFNKHGYIYTIFDDYEGDSKPKMHQRGVQVTPPIAGQKVTTLMCYGATIGNLSDLKSIVPCDKDDPLNMGDCP